MKRCFFLSRMNEISSIKFIVSLISLPSIRNQNIINIKYNSIITCIKKMAPGKGNRGDKNFASIRSAIKKRNKEKKGRKIVSEV